MISLPDKPKLGAPCNGCGVCCARLICPAGEIAYPGAHAPCPGLKITPGRSRTYCELVAGEILSGAKPLLQAALGIGRGCSMDDNLDGIA